MQLKSALLPSILLFTSLAAATKTLTVTEVQEHTSYTVVDTVTSTGSAPAGSQTPYVLPSQSPLTTLGLHSSGVAPNVYPTIASTGMPTPAGNYSLPTAPSAPTKTKPPAASATGAAARGFSGSIGMAVAVGALVAMVGSL